MVKLSQALILGRSRASDLENVRKLNVWGSELTDVSIIRKCSNVQVVSLSVNEIATLADFAHCQNLEELYIRKNNITALAEICHLKGLPKLRVLWLDDNPCAEQEKYRLTVLKTLPNLQKLDNIAVQDNELNSAIEQGEELTLPSVANGNTEEVQEASSHVVADHGDDTTENKQSDDNIKEDSPEENDAPIDSVDETNQIRQQLGLKPISVEKLTPVRPRASTNAKARNANVLQAALCLVKELDPESLEILSDAVRNRLDVL